MRGGDHSLDDDDIHTTTNPQCHEVYAVKHVKVFILTTLSHLFHTSSTLRFQDLEDCCEDIALRNQLWISRRSWAELAEGLLEGRFDQVWNICVKHCTRPQKC